MRYYCISVLICALALWPLSALAQGAPTVDVETYGLRISERTIEVLFKVTERGSGRDLQGLRPADLVVLENGTPVNSSVELREEASDANGERTIPLAAARQLGAALDTLALYGIVGAALTVIVLGAASLVGDVPVASPIMQQISQSLTRAMTRAINPGRKGGLVGQYGILTVTQGATTGSQHTVRNATIGKQDADILITDTVVSRRHARLEVHGDVVRIIDEQSTNGTYVVRNGQEYELNGTAFELSPGDTIYLGPPSAPTAVAMIYEKKGA